MDCTYIAFFHTFMVPKVPKGSQIQGSVSCPRTGARSSTTNPSVTGRPALPNKPRPICRPSLCRTGCAKLATSTNVFWFQQARFRYWKLVQQREQRAASEKEWPQEERQARRGGGESWGDRCVHWGSTAHNLTYYKNHSLNPKYSLLLSAFHQWRQKVRCRAKLRLQDDTGIYKNPFRPLRSRLFNQRLFSGTVAIFS